jgi:nucleoside 2-deoxyribosyltransferase
MKVYLAGPDVFLPKPDEMGRRKKELCTQYGLTGLFPLDNAIDPKARDASTRIFRSNEDLMKEADAIIANLTPFRGPSADTGTVYELGYMAACGKLCLGYSNDPAPYVDRVKRFGAVEPCGDHLIDAEKLTVENFGLADNLMMIHALDRYGCRLVVAKTAPADIWLDLTSFEECVKLAAARLPTSTASS